MSGTTEREDWFVRAAGAVGDLSNPFYDEERRRDVWNEASAVGFQLMLVLGLVAATAMIWIGGPPAEPYVMVMIGVIGLASVVTLVYAEKLGVRVTEASRTVWWRMAPYAALVIALTAGLVVRSETEFSVAYVVGLIVGAGVAIAALWVGVRAGRRKEIGEEINE